MVVRSRRGVIERRRTRRRQVTVRGLVVQSPVRPARVRRVVRVGEGARVGKGRMVLLLLLREGTVDGRRKIRRVRVMRVVRHERRRGRQSRQVVQIGRVEIVRLRALTPQVAVSLEYRALTSVADDVGAGSDSRSSTGHSAEAPGRTGSAAAACPSAASSRHTLAAGAAAAAVGGAAVVAAAASRTKTAQARWAGARGSVPVAVVVVASPQATAANASDLVRGSHHPRAESAIAVREGSRRYWAGLADSDPLPDRRC